MHRRLTFLALLSTVSLGACATMKYTRAGDEAAQKGDWVAAERNYRRAVETSPNSEPLQAMHKDARDRAVVSTTSAAKSCAQVLDDDCVLARTGEALELQPGDSEMSALRASAAQRKSVREVARARDLAGRAEFGAALEVLAGARAMTTDPATLAMADEVVAGLAPGAEAYATALLEEAESASGQRKASMYGEGRAILEGIVAQRPNVVPLLAKVRARSDSARAEVEAARQEVAERQREAAEAERKLTNRTVHFHGVLVAPTKSGGEPWDGPPFSDSEGLSSRVSGALAATDPISALSVVLADSAIGATRMPDVAGFARCLDTGESRHLSKRQDSLTPQWAGASWANVNLKTSRIEVALEDLDLTDNDSVGSFQIGSEALVAAFEAGVVSSVDVRDQTGGQVLYAMVSVR